MRRKTGSGCLLLLAALCALLVGSDGGWYFDCPTAETLEVLGLKVSDRTRSLYNSAWQDFLREAELQADWYRLRPEQQDFAVAHYLSVGLKGEELSRTHAGYVLAQLRLVSPMYDFPLSHRVFCVWKHKHPAASAWPLTPNLCEALCAVMCMGGRKACAIVTLLCFCSLLRVGEALKLRWEHVYLGSPGELRGALYLATTKAGTEAHVPILSPLLVLLLKS